MCEIVCVPFQAAISDDGVLALPLQITNPAEFFQPRLAKVAINDEVIKEVIKQRLKQEIDSDQHEVSVNRLCFLEFVFEDCD